MSMGSYHCHDEKAALSRLRAEARRKAREALEAATDPRESYFAQLSLPAAPVPTPRVKPPRPPKPPPEPYDRTAVACRRLERLLTEALAVWRKAALRWLVDQDHDGSLIYGIALGRIRGGIPVNPEHDKQLNAIQKRLDKTTPAAKALKARWNTECRRLSRSLRQQLNLSQRCRYIAFLKGIRKSSGAEKTDKGEENGIAD
jgi:hypothetical protein